MMNLLGTVAWLEILLTLEIGTAPKTKVALTSDGSSAQSTVDFMMGKEGGQVSTRGRINLLYSQNSRTPDMPF